MGPVVASPWLSKAASGVRDEPSRRAQEFIGAIVLQDCLSTLV
jgi:hypothetical protein